MSEFYSHSQIINLLGCHESIIGIIWNITKFGDHACTDWWTTEVGKTILAAYVKNKAQKDESITLYWGYPLKLGTTIHKEGIAPIT